MHIFDVLGPVMIGPSSSHTAGAVKIGYVTRKLLGEAPGAGEHSPAWFVCGYRLGTWYRPCCDCRTAGL